MEKTEAVAAPSTSAAPVTPWIPEDDVLLKNAVEAGASLEALAKGAVRFSRRYTLQELQDRWHSLLYNTDIATQASACILEIENSAINISSKINSSYGAKESEMEHGKRKRETIRSEYYLMRKRLQAEYFSSTDLGFLAETSLPTCEHGVDLHQHAALDGLQVGNFMLEDCMLQDGNLGLPHHVFPPQLPGTNATGDVHNTGDAFQSEGSHSLAVGDNHTSGCSDSPRNEEGVAFCRRSMPLWETMQDILPPCMPKLGSEDASPFPVVHSGSLTDGGDVDGFASIIMSEADLANLSESLLYFSQDNEILPRNEDGKDMMDMSSYENSVPVDVIMGETPSVQPESTVSQFNTMASSACTTVSDSQHQERNHGQICCVLNTEDPEIPCNDDIFLVIHSATPDGTMNVTDPISSAVKDKANRLNGSKKGEEHPQCVTPTKMVGSSVLPATGTEHPVVGCTIKPEFLEPALPIAPRRAKKAIGGSTQRKPARKIANRAKNEKLDGGREVENGMVNKPGKTDKIPLHAEVGGAIETTPPESIVQPTPDQEEPDSENDVPYFSDIEAMILEKDLDLQDEDLYFSRLVSRYQNDDSKRKIIRLEQGAQSALQRTLACHGALAIFYGRHLKHFIRKAEVILGRPTAQIGVDIDLGKEGRAKKISRKQAEIKMGRGGSFFLINHGRTPIFVNGKEVVMGRSLRLSASCLIQIREMDFVFETDPKLVRQYLDNVVKKRQHAAHQQSATKVVQEREPTKEP